MIDIDLIKANYQRLTTPELIDLASKPWDLEVDVVPYLQEELIQRNESAAAIALTNYLITIHQRQPNPESLKYLSKSELAEMIRARIDSGETLEGIKLDLKDNGIEMFDILSDEVKLHDKTLEYLTALKDDDVPENEIEEKLSSAFGTTDEENDLLKKQLKSRGKQNLVIGYAIVIIISVLSVTALAMGGSIGFSALILIALGIWRITLGYRQVK